MSLISMILILSLFVLIILIGNVFYKKTGCCETGGRDVFNTIGIIGLSISLIIFIPYSIESGRYMKVEKIKPTFFKKSKTKIYLEFDFYGHHKDFTFDKMKDMYNINKTTTFYLCKYMNHWHYYYYEIHIYNDIYGLKNKELNKWIKNRW